MISSKVTSECAICWQHWLPCVPLPRMLRIFSCTQTSMWASMSSVCSYMVKLHISQLMIWSHAMATQMPQYSQDPSETSCGWSYYKNVGLKQLAHICQLKEWHQMIWWRISQAHPHSVHNLLMMKIKKCQSLITLKKLWSTVKWEILLYWDRIQMYLKEWLEAMRTPCSNALKSIKKWYSKLETLGAVFNG